MSLLKLNQENNGDPVTVPKAAIVSFGPRPEGAQGVRIELASGGAIHVAETLEEVTAAYEAAT